MNGEDWARDRSLQVAPPTGDAEIDAMRPWFHNLHLPDGRQTSPRHQLGDFPRNKWERLAPHLPEDLTGWRVLDIGCNAGFYTFALAGRGADVTAVDVEEHYLRQGQWASERMRVKGQVTFRRAGVWDILQERDRYDLVLFMGLFYHLRYPLLALDGLASRAERLLVFQTLVADGDGTRPGTGKQGNDGSRRRGDGRTPDDVPFEEADRLLSPGWPTMAFIEHAFAGDPTNWWVPTEGCVQALLRSAGMRPTVRFDDGAFVCEPRGAHVDRDVADPVRVAAALESGARQPTLFDDASPA